MRLYAWTGALAALCCLYLGPSATAAGRYAQAAPAASPDAEQQCRLEWFAYDRTLPLDAQVGPLDTTPSSTRYRVEFTSVHDQRVPAILALPRNTAAPYPAVILVHGSGGSKSTSYIVAASEALTRCGYATIAIDTQYHGDRRVPGRSGEIHMPDSYTMRDAWVQSVVDIRRTVDYLESRKDIDPARLGYLGFSQGAMLGAIFGGIDRRVGVFCLAVPGGGFLNIIRHISRYPILRDHWPSVTTPALMAKVERIANITDPAHYVAGISPRPLLILVAKYDEIIPPEGSQAIVNAVSNDPNLQVAQIPSGHVLNPVVLFQIRDYFVKELGQRPART